MKVVNEKTYPIQAVWVIKNFIYIVIRTAGFLIPVCFVLFYSHARVGMSIVAEFIVAIVFAIVLHVAIFIALVLRKIKFQYEFGEKNIILKQGIISKSERHIFYGRIQNISLSQDFVDKFLGIASLLIETASDSGGAKLLTEAKNDRSREFGWFKLGFYSNCILIPGLLYDNASDFKKFIMEQMIANPIDDAQSGL